MKIIKLFYFPFHLLSWLSKFTFLVLIEIFIYPINTHLFKKKQIKNVDELTEDEKNQLEDCYKKIYEKFNIEKGHKTEFLDSLNYFASLDSRVIYDSTSNQLCPINLQYIFILFEQALEGSKLLDSVSKDDKSVAYYEASSKIDDLVKMYKDRLNAKNEQELLLKATKNEFRLKKWIAHMRKIHHLFFNMYLLFLTLFPPDKFKMNKKDRELLPLMKNLFSFYRLGHATPKQIHKSMAIQIYKLYEMHDNVKRDQLKDKIGDLIDYVMHTDTPYKNFNDIDQEAYIKNIVQEFLVFDCHTDTSRHQMKSFKRYFVYKNTIYPWWLPRFIRTKIFNRFLDTPLLMYRRMAFMTFFGFLSKKK
ncbi:MAG: hypothetical protein Q8R58_07840 [Sulfuricurvum sp.]|nr:hypothetical protein [Sulfuricurvum sp.]